jgi:phage FluMu protein Com
MKGVEIRKGNPNGLQIELSGKTLQRLKAISWQRHKSIQALVSDAIISGKGLNGLLQEATLCPECKKPLTHNNGKGSYECKNPSCSIIKVRVDKENNVTQLKRAAV